MPARETRSEKQARLAYAYEQARAERDRIIAHMADISAELQPLLPADGTPVTDLNYEGHDIQATLVTGETRYFDEVGFGKTLPTKIWNSITRRTIDQDRLAVAIKDQVISPAQVAAYTKTEPKKSSVRITMKARI